MIKPKILIISLIVSCIIILITVAVLSINFILGMFPIATNQIVSEYASPDGKYKAILYTRDAGATTKESYQLSILKEGEKLKNKGGNVLITYSKFEVEWENNQTLLVKLLEDKEIFKQENKIRNIQIKYDMIKAK